MRALPLSTLSLLAALLPACIGETGKDPETSEHTPPEKTIPSPLPDGGSEDFSGALDCSAPQSILFDGEESEVIQLDTTFTLQEDTLLGSTPSMTLRLAGEPVVRNGNPVNVSGAVYVNEPLDGSVTLNLLETGTYELLYEVSECGAIRFESTLTRVRVSSENLDRSSATLLTDGRAEPGVLSCEEERWFELELEDGDTIEVDVGSSALIEGEGDSSIELMDANGDNVMESGNPLSLNHYFGPDSEESAREMAFEDGGTYYLKVYFWNGCTIGDFYVRYFTL